jgi:uncharacterized protein with HEPN domain
VSSDDERALDWLADLVENANRIHRYLGGMTFEQFAGNLRVRDAVERCIERIAGAAVRLGPIRLAAIAPSPALHELRGLGNLLRHAYDRIDPKLIWDTATFDVPELSAASSDELRRRGQ